MKRAKHPTPFILKKFLHYNPTNGYYEITEEEITYHLTMEQTVSIKKYFRDNEGAKPTPVDWFNSLSKDEKKKVKRTGMQDNTEYFNDGGHIE